MKVTAGDVVPDLLGPDLRVVFCGTRPSTASAQRRAYYAKPGNRFWPTLHATGLTPMRLAPENFRSLLALGIGLTDVAKASAGQDATMQPDDIDIERLWSSMRLYRPGILAFTSKTAALHALGLSGTGRINYGPVASPLAGIEVHVLPSTSGLATSHWDIAPWQALADRIRELQHATA